MDRMKPVYRIAAVGEMPPSRPHVVWYHGIRTALAQIRRPKELDVADSNGRIVTRRHRHPHGPGTTVSPSASIRSKRRCRATTISALHSLPGPGHSSAFQDWPRNQGKQVAHSRNDGSADRVDPALQRTSTAKALTSRAEAGASEFSGRNVDWTSTASRQAYNATCAPAAWTVFLHLCQHFGMSPAQQRPAAQRWDAPVKPGCGAGIQGGRDQAASSAWCRERRSGSRRRRARNSGGLAGPAFQEPDRLRTRYGLKATRDCRLFGLRRLSRASP